MSGWGCPHEVDGLCLRLKGAYCDPGMRGCVLDGKVTFVDGLSHVPRWPAPGVGNGPRTAGSTGLPDPSPTGRLKTE